MSGWAQVETELQAVNDRARTLVDSTHARLFTVRPTPSQWSAAECLAHLSISTELFLPTLRRAIDDASADAPATKPVTPKMDPLGRILRWFLEPPVRARVKTSTPFVPKSVRAKSEALAEFVNLQQQLLELVKAATEVPVANRKIVSAFDSRVRYTVYSAFLILTAHQRRHLWQAEQAVAALKR